MLRSHIEGGNGNCKKRDPIEILSVITDILNSNKKATVNTNTITRAALIWKYDSSPRRSWLFHSPNISVISEFKKASISYIAGKVAKKVEKQLICSDCCTALGSETNTPPSEFLKLKDKVKLYKPTQSVIQT